MATKVVSVKRTLWDALYLPAIVQGLGITLRHFFVNTFGSREIETLRYGEKELKDYVPDPKKPEGWRGKKKFRDLPERHRGRHRLMKRPDGEVRCTACMMCATVCPAHCIHIEAGERENPTNRSIEKYPVKFEIDELVCVVCGFCVEACPCDAIRMDSQIMIPPVTRRDDAVLEKPALAELGGTSIAVDGGAGPNWREEYVSLGTVRQIYRPERRHADKDLGYRHRDAARKRID
ncbi:MAG: NADH-quinone oxidoreductase subunit I [Deltaproteobacteria bacterium]|nr:NADH-quinone oxidoreductase subunit I [Deltaproteobacteria bacterium]